MKQFLTSFLNLLFASNDVPFAFIMFGHLDIVRDIIFFFMLSQEIKVEIIPKP